ncbi:hypothetical protein, partial [Alistipes finegoldii]|uniref:hypothetical protein n=1 Tax=Alistipes finegoldii TaxID=214856 RepID=UPI003F734D9D
SSKVFLSIDTISIYINFLLLFLFLLQRKGLNPIKQWLFQNWQHLAPVGSGCPGYNYCLKFGIQDDSERENKSLIQLRP